MVKVTEKTNTNKQERYLVTSALPYINGVKHLGNLIGSLLPADIYSRYLRLRGKDVIYICGTDDHGTPAELAALAAEIEVSTFCDKQYKIQSDIYKRFNIKFDYFGKTSAPVHHELTKEIFIRLRKRGFLYEKTTEQLFCNNCNRFLPDRYVTGTCPKCGYENARGDQCEDCTAIHDSIELVEPQCAICKEKNLSIKKSKHLFLSLVKLEEDLKKWLDQKDYWPKTTIQIARKWMREGLKDRCITRDLKWGVAVPFEGFEDKVFYVWAEAPLGYISITKEWAIRQGRADLWKKYWKNPSTKLVNFLAKDNIPFHTITFPGTIMGLADDYILPYYVKGFQWLNFEGGKFSTSQNRGVFTDTALELFPADYWRYYLVVVAPERHDTDFNWEEFLQVINSDLANAFGNLVHRTLLFIVDFFNGEVPKVNEFSEESNKLLDEIEKTKEEVQRLLDDIQFQKAVFRIRELTKEANRYFNARQPWKTIKEDEEHSRETLSVSAHLCKSLAILLEPFIPASTEKIYEWLGVSKSVHEERWENIGDFTSLAGNKIRKPDKPLFAKIQKKEIQNLRERFRGERISKDKKRKNKGKEHFIPDLSQKKKEKKVEERGTKMDYASIDDLVKLGLKIGVITKVERVLKTDKLLRIEVDLGEETRQIIAGLGEIYSPDELMGKNIVVVTNLKPRKLRGLKSQGMLLAAESGELISILTTDKKLPPGAIIR